MGNVPVFGLLCPLNCRRRPQKGEGCLAALPQCGSTAVLADLTIVAHRCICCCCYCCLCHTREGGREGVREAEGEGEGRNGGGNNGIKLPRYLLAQHFLQFIYLYIPLILQLAQLVGSKEGKYPPTTQKISPICIYNFSVVQNSLIPRFLHLHESCRRHLQTLSRCLSALIYWLDLTGA